jgi:hypothetical protein
MLSSKEYHSDNMSEYFFIDSTHSNLPLQPTNTLVPSSPAQQTVPLCTMQLEKISEFSGTQEDMMQPSDFLKAIKGLFLTSGTTMDDKKVSLFKLYLKSNSLAEEWYNDAKAPKKMWLELKQEFKIRFPNITKTMKTAPELKRELGTTMRITTEELGKTEKYQGEEVYTHMIFAEKILDLAK